MTTRLPTATRTVAGADTVTRIPTPSRRTRALRGRSFTRRPKLNRGTSAVFGSVYADQYGSHAPGRVTTRSPPQSATWMPSLSAHATRDPSGDNEGLGGHEGVGRLQPELAANRRPCVEAQDDARRRAFALRRIVGDDRQAATVAGGGSVEARGPAEARVAEPRRHGGAQRVPVNVVPSPSKRDVAAQEQLLVADPRRPDEPVLAGRRGDRGVGAGHDRRDVALDRLVVGDAGAVGREADVGGRLRRRVLVGGGGHGITLTGAPAAVQRCTWPVASEAANVPSSAADGHS